jgi:hypothetical protein
MEPTDPTPETPVETPASDAAPESALADDGVVATAGEAPPTPPEETLAQLVEKAQLGRLAPAEEERASAAIKELLLAGKSGVATVAAALPKLAWMIGVSGVTAAWPEMKATPKGQLLKALADDETDAARRFRLSLARGLYKLQDVPTTLKIGVGVAKEMREKETGEIALRNAQMFANVFIGKAKPWCSLLPLADLKNSEADALVHCAVLAVFTLQHLPVTQLGVIKWAAEAGRLATLDATALGALTKTVERWPGKWHNILRNEVAELPAEILAVLKPAESVLAESPESQPAEDADSEENSEGDSNGEEGAPKPKERPVYISKTIPPKETRDGQEGRESREAREPRDARDARETRGPQPVPGARERGVSPKSPQFNAAEALRQIEAHVGWLKAELKTAESKSRARDDDPRRARQRKPEVTVIEGEPTPEELARLNVQLEARIGELQARVDDLTADSEVRAASSGVLTDAPPPSPDAQLRTLLALKLQEGYGDFLALEQESRDLVARQHYRTLMREVFDVLRNEGVELTAPPEEPAR